MYRENNRWSATMKLRTHLYGDESSEVNASSTDGWDVHWSGGDQISHAYLLVTESSSPSNTASEVSKLQPKLSVIGYSFLAARIE